MAPKTSNNLIGFGEVDDFLGFVATDSAFTANCHDHRAACLRARAVVLILLSYLLRLVAAHIILEYPPTSTHS
jgi:hypothetical protein